MNGPANRPAQNEEKKHTIMFCISFLDKISGIDRALTVGMAVIIAWFALCWTIGGIITLTRKMKKGGDR